MIELLVIIAIFAFLLSLISSSYKKIQLTVNKLECANNLRSISFAATAYKSDSNGYILGSRKNHNRWFRSNGDFVSLSYRAAYWGRYYSDYLGERFGSYKNNFKCPEAKLVKYTSFEPYGQYATYGFNGVRTNGENPFFEDWNNAKVFHSDAPSNLAMIHDAYEPMMEGDGRDTPDQNIPTIEEYRRHDWAISTLWADGHHSFVEGDWDIIWYAP
jgi:type II secretory pathway pseudopilin PulG